MLKWILFGGIIVQMTGFLFSCSMNQDNTSDIRYFHNGTIYSMDQNLTVHTAMIVENGLISALGGNELKSRLEGREYEDINLDGKFVFPGLIEGHGHFLMLGEVICGLDLNGLASWQEVIDQTVEYAQKVSEEDWILGKGWHPNHWDTLPPQLTEGYPDNRELTRLFPNRPVVLQHSSFHALMANDKALEMAGITADTPDPAGGRIVRDNAGKATGMLEENAMDMVMQYYRGWKNNRTAQEKEVELNRYIDSAMQRCLSYGITTFVDAGISASDLATFEKCHEQQGLDIRLWAMAAGGDLIDGDFDGKVPYESADQKIFVKATKSFIDGALGSNGAWMIHDYEDQKDWYGQNVTERSELKSIGQKCIDLGMQYAIHAIGDRANREVLDIYEALFRENDLDGSALRWRVEHAQIIQPEDIPRFSELGVIPSMQAIHATSDAPMVVPKIGAELAEKGAYPWRALIDHGAVIANGTDCPVERVNPFENLYASVTRQSGPGQPAFFPGQSMSRAEALRSLTIWNAFACNLDNHIGSLKPGKWADFFVSDTDLLNCSDADILATGVTQTYLNGNLVWSR